MSGVDRSRIGGRSTPPTDEEIADQSIVGWLFDKPFAIRHGLRPELLMVANVDGRLKVFKLGSADSWGLEALEGYWLPIRIPMDGS